MNTFRIWPTILIPGIAVVIGFATHWSLGVVVFLVAINFIDQGNTEKPRCYTKNEIAEVPCDIESIGAYNQDVVGESNYTENIKQIIPAEYKNKDCRLYFIVTLNQEVDNKYDKNAVGVMIENKVGHLPADVCKKYRAWARKNNAPNSATCRGVVVGKNGGYGIYLDLPI